MKFLIALLIFFSLQSVMYAYGENPDMSDQKGTPNETQSSGTR